MSGSRTAIPTSRPDVLIVGADPTGLVIALFLCRFGGGVCIIEKDPVTESTSRAIVVHARTLEFYRQLGIADRVVDAAQKFLAVNIWVNGRVRGRLNFGDIGGPLSRFPYSLIFPQDEHERLLIDALQERGIQVERGAELLEMVEQDGRRDNDAQTCNGNHEGMQFIVRRRLRRSAFDRSRKLGIALAGGTYSHLWYVATSRQSVSSRTTKFRSRCRNGTLFQWFR